MTQATATVSPRTATIGIIGGGIAGSTIALRLAELGIKVILIESGPSLVNGPPICHLHAGGNLYREISQQQCITLLKQSIEMLRLYPNAADYRPTVIAVPQHDKGSPQELIPRLNRLQHEYSALVASDPANQVLGQPQQYYQTFSRSQVEQLAKLPALAKPKTLAQWLIPVAKSLDLNQLKFPLIVVQEYGLSVFRLAATASLVLEQLDSCQLVLNTKVTALKRDRSTNGWLITAQQDSSAQSSQISVDYLINACGFRTGIIDDLVGETQQRMVEFKAAYVTQWPLCDTTWPEVIFYGERGTPNGMAQLTPYPGGYFQIHGMTQDITLFEHGLVATTQQSAQPQLPQKYISKLTAQWPAEVAQQRTEKSIAYMAKFIPEFATATVGGKPLFGAQQIPGLDPSLRAADVSFSTTNYARCEIVKASSALTAADHILSKLVTLNIIKQPATWGHYFPSVERLIDQDITNRAELLTQQRNYPIALANRNTAND